ncbi:hypothetical protein VU03_01230, partial [Desulfobulbus sp. N3]|nr:hypothetical protein [Desulfobulbus sp. N3]
MYCNQMISAELIPEFLLVIFCIIQPLRRKISPNEEVGDLLLSEILQNRFDIPLRLFEPGEKEIWVAVGVEEM